jgi:hypothetical protein
VPSQTVRGPCIGPNQLRVADLRTCIRFVVLIVLAAKALWKRSGWAEVRLLRIEGHLSLQFSQFQKYLSGAMKPTFRENEPREAR